jgi:mannose-6-phosphate isomerase-like protein (cupin superfamily)
MAAMPDFAPLLAPLLLVGAPALAQPADPPAAPPANPPAAPAPDLPARREAVVIGKADIDRALAARVGAKGMGAVAAVRAGDDRVGFDVLRRDTPDEGPVVHEQVTEIYTILEGGGDFTMGGTLVDPHPMVSHGKPSNPASIGPSLKGSAVVGGVSRHLAAGDVVMIPPHVAHGFTRLDGHVAYTVVRLNPGYEKDR